MIAKTTDYFKLQDFFSFRLCWMVDSRSCFGYIYGAISVTFHLIAKEISMKNFVILILSAMTITFSVTGFQCATAEMTSGKMALQRQEWENAERSFEQEVTKNPENAEAWYSLGRVRHELKNYKGMNDAFERSIALSKEFQNEIGNVRLGTWGQLFNSGIESYLKSKSVQGDSVTILLRMAIDRFMLGIMVNPDSAATYTNLGLAYLGLNDFDKAVSNFEISLQKYQDPDLTLSLGAIYLERGRTLQKEAQNATGSKKDSLEKISKPLFDKTIAMLEPASKQWPDNSNIVGMLLDAYLAAGRMDEARINFKEAVEKRPNDKLLRYNYGVLLLKAGDYTGSVKQFEAAVVTDPQFEDALYNLGVSYLQWGAKRRSDAEKATKGSKEKKIDKSYEEQFRKGKDALERLRDMKPNDPDIWEALGQAYANLNMAKAANEAFTKADDLRKGK